jgi:hypothetical protein
MNVRIALPTHSFDLGNLKLIREKCHDCIDGTQRTCGICGGGYCIIHNEGSNLSHVSPLQILAALVIEASH